MHAETCARHVIADQLADMRPSNFAGMAAGQPVFPRTPEFVMLQEDPAHLSSL